MLKKCKIKKGDVVLVIAGRDKGKQGTVISVYPKESKVVVTGVNIVKRHTKPSMANSAGGIINKEAPIHISNVAYLDPNSGARTKIGIKFIGDNQKVRFAKHSGEIING